MWACLVVHALMLPQVGCASLVLHEWGWECPRDFWTLPCPSIGLAEASYWPVGIYVVWLEERLSLCCWLCGGGFAPPTQEVDCVVVVGVWWNVIVCLLVLTRLYCTIGIVCGLLVGFRQSVKISWWMGILEEQDGAVVGVFWPRPASGPLSIIKCTLPALAVTLLQRTWLNGYFLVVYNARSFVPVLHLKHALCLESAWASTWWDSAYGGREARNWASASSLQQLCLIDKRCIPKGKLIFCEYTCCFDHVSVL